ncbi:DUF4917 family protein [Acinetobacter sp. 197]|uniref:DUF4917 family protein n=1 Tax=Acinetobacter sp. 197 TaxID=3114696 RepID=UPI003A854ABD
MFKIVEWQEIENNFFDGMLIIGNGASIAIDSRFSYTSLVDYAKSNNLLSSDIETLFKSFDTNDFELILRIVWQAAQVNKSLQIEDNKTYQAYLNIRNALIETVRAIHPSYEEVEPHLPYIHDFIRNFRRIFSLNYDLIVYWAIMYGNDHDLEYKFKDCFVNGEFEDNWKKFQRPYHGKKSRLVFYPHGSLIFGKTLVEREIKVSTVGDSNLLDSILDAWRSEKVIPLFVSEGTAKQKINSIKSSGYLHTVYREAFQSGLKEKYIIYGWGLGEQDLHILDNLNRYSFPHAMEFAVSVYGNDQAYCNKIFEILSRKFHNSKITFFKSNSPGCWNNPRAQIYNQNLG